MRSVEFETEVVGITEEVQEVALGISSCETHSFQSPLLLLIDLDVEPCKRSGIYLRPSSTHTAIETSASSRRALYHNILQS